MRCCASLLDGIDDGYVIDLLSVASAVVMRAVARWCWLPFASLIAFNFVITSVCSRFRSRCRQFFSLDYDVFIGFNLLPFV